jgi:hypothetical protein
MITKYGVFLRSKITLAIPFQVTIWFITLSSYFRLSPDEMPFRSIRIVALESVDKIFTESYDFAAMILKSDAHIQKVQRP